MNTAVYLSLLITTFIITGTCNVLLVELINHTTSRGRDGKILRFEHPFFETFIMFVGTALCMIAFKMVHRILTKRQDNSLETNRLVKGTADFKSWLLMLPAVCDLFSRSIYLIAMFMTFASSFLILRGSSVLFIPVLSFFFFRRRPSIQQWCGIYCVTFGLLILGILQFLNDRDSSTGDYDTYTVVTGYILVLVAELLKSTQMVYEEEVLLRMDINPLKAAGWEGVYGTIISAILLLIFNFIKAPEDIWINSTTSIEDTADTFIKMFNNYHLILECFGLILSYAVYSFDSLAIIKEMSATTCNIIGNVHVVIVWVVYLTIGWQEFHEHHIVGIILIIVGILIYNDVLVAKLIKKLRKKDEDISSPVPETQNKE